MACLNRGEERVQGSGLRFAEGRVQEDQRQSAPEQYETGMKDSNRREYVKGNGLWIQWKQISAWTF
jgi:hypothetical protein